MVDFMRICYWWTTLDIGKSNTADSENVKFELIEKCEKYVIIYINKTQVYNNPR